MSDLYTNGDLPEAQVVLPAPALRPLHPEDAMPGSYMPHYHTLPTSSRSPSNISFYGAPAVPDVAPLIPASWTPPEIDWRYGLTPPGPMVIPNMLQETESAGSASPEYLEAVAQPSQPLTHFPETSAVASSIGSRLSTPRSESVFEESRSPAGLQAPESLPELPSHDRLVDIDVPQTVIEAADVNSTGSAVGNTQPIPHLGPIENPEWRELWPELTSVLRHLLQPPSPPAVDATTPVPEVSNVKAEAISREPSTATLEFETPVESPLGQEPLLSRPEGSEMVERTRDFGHNLAEYLSHVISPPIVVAPPRPRYSATFVSDSHISEGQIFPPGAEFVKSWRMCNSGDVAWPENTTLRYVAGDRLVPQGTTTQPVHVGTVEPGAETELIGGEMKAPELPGKYVSYWRLHDGEQYFGSSVWVE